MTMCAEESTAKAKASNTEVCMMEAVMDLCLPSDEGGLYRGDQILLALRKCEGVSSEYSNVVPFAFALRGVMVARLTLYLGIVCLRQLGDQFQSAASRCSRYHKVRIPAADIKQDTEERMAN